MSHKHLRVDERSITEQLRDQIKNLKKFPTEKSIRCQNFQQDKAGMSLFTASTKKEQLMLECIKRYETYFRENYDNRPLLLYPSNEAGVQKFICSFIRPTQVTYIELFDYLECVRFISNFMMYEELEEPRRFPETIVSPYNSTRWQIGDSADIAVLTASLLLGVGFDVFVVVGEAHHEITKKNENNVACFFLTKEDFELRDNMDEKQGDVAEAATAASNSTPEPAFQQQPQPPASFVRDERKDGNKSITNGRANGNTTLMGDRTGQSGQFFNFDLTRQTETFTENRIFDQYNHVKNSEENPYYKPVIKNEAKKYDQLIFAPQQPLKNSRRATQTATNFCTEDIFYKDPNKYMFKTNYEAQFKVFLKDDEPLRLKIQKQQVSNDTAVPHHATMDRQKMKADTQSLHQTQINSVTKIAETQAEHHAHTAANSAQNDAETGIHFWLLLRPSTMRDVKKAVFIDPISGRVWDVDSTVLPFYSIKQIFNHRNCWINLNETTPLKYINFENFDNYQNDDFEFVLNEEVFKSDKNKSALEEEELAQADRGRMSMADRLSARKSLFMQTAENALSEFANNAKLSQFGSGGGSLMSVQKESNGYKGTLNRNNAYSHLLSGQDQNADPNRLAPKKFAEKIINMEELFQRPSVWVPKFDIARDKFLAKFAKNRQRKFYQKCQVDYFSRLTQTDGLVKRVQIFMDHSRLLMREVRSYYSDRSDKLRVKREFPFEFKTIEFYDSFGSTPQNMQQNIVPHWREIETQIGRKITFKFYPLRFNDGLIEREEIIGEKTIERFINRDDKLIYSSVRFQKISVQSNYKDTYNYEDRHVGSVQILKMVQKFEKNPRMDGSAQIAKVIIDLERNNIKLIYHLDAHQISPVIMDTNRECFTGIISRAEKKALANGAGQSKVQFLYALEKDCFSKIKVAENMMVNDIKNFKNVVEEVGLSRQDKPQAEESQQQQNQLYSDSVITSQPLATEKNKDAEIDVNAEDRIETELKNRGLLGQRIDQSLADEIKRDILAEVEDRFIQRADVINKRFEEEKAKVKSIHKKIQKKTFDAASTPDEDRTFEEELYNFNLKIAILEQRLFNFQKVAFEKYAEVQNQLNSDPRLNNLS